MLASRVREAPRLPDFQRAVGGIVDWYYFHDLLEPIKYIDLYANSE